MKRRTDRWWAVTGLVGAFAAVLVAGGPTPAGAATPVCDVVDQVTVSSGGSNVNVSYDGDGSRMAFVSDRNYVGTNADGNNEIFVYDVETATFTQVTTTTGSGGVNVPSISADGQRVAFQSSKNLTGSNSDGNNEIFLWDATGPTLTQVTISPTGRTNAAPKLAANGTHVAFSSDADLTSGGNSDLNQEIFRWTVAGATTTQVTTTTGGTGANANPTISADGSKVAFRSNRDIGGANSETNSEIFLWDAAGPTTTAVTTAASGASDSPSMSSNGNRIAFRSTANLGGGNSDANQEIFLWDATGPTITQITATTSGSSDGASLAADGTRLAFKSSRDLTGANADLTNEIFAWDEADGFTQITDTPVGGGGNRAPAIARDGSSIAFESDRDVTGANSDRNFEQFRTACGLEVTKSADQTSAVIGGTIDYHVTVHNGGPFTLTGLYVDDPGAPECSQALADLPSGQSVTVDCTFVPSLADLGNHPNVATADADQSPPVASNQVDVEVTYPASTGSVVGVVTDEVSDAPLPGVWVAALRTSDFSLAGGAVADGDGAFAAVLPAGTYFLYLIDPTAAHGAGFHGRPTPTLVVVDDGAQQVVAVEMAPTRGQITGTVTDQVSGDPLEGAIALSIGGPSSSPEAGMVTGPSGEFTLPDLPAGNHWVGYVDPTGAHTPEFHPHSPNVPNATPVVVAGGSTTVADGSLPTQTVTPGGELLTGTVTDAATGDPLGDILVVALRAADYQSVRTTFTDGAGAYTFDLVAGDYRLAFVALDGRHHMQWYDGLPNTGLGDSVIVTAPQTADAALVPALGSMAGTVTADPGGSPLAGAWVVAIGPQGIVAGAVTGADGAYTIHGLPAGVYRATYLDLTGGRAQEYWPDSPTYDGGSDLVIAGGSTTTADAVLGAP